MRPVSFKELLTRPALLIAAGLVLLGAAAGRTSAAGDLAPPEGERSCRATKPTFDALCRCLTASLASDDESGFGHVGLHAAFEPVTGGLAEQVLPRPGSGGRDWLAPRARLRQCCVGPSPPVGA